MVCLLRDADWIYVYNRYNPLQSPVVTICTIRINIQQFCVLPTQCIYVFCVDLRKKSDYFLVQH